MPIFHVHLYRVMNLYFPGIEAESADAAAQIAANKRTDQAARIDDCEGDNITALIDTDGHTEFQKSKTIDFANIVDIPNATQPTAATAKTT